MNDNAAQHADFRRGRVRTVKKFRMYRPVHPRLEHAQVECRSCNSSHRRNPA